MWLASSYDCVMVSDVISVSAAKMSAGGGSGSVSALQPGAQSHLMRKVYGPDFLGQLGGKSTNSFALVVFLCFANHSQAWKCSCFFCKTDD